MAIGMKAWIAIAIAGCVLVAVAYLPGVDRERNERPRRTVVGVDSFFFDPNANPQYLEITDQYRYLEAALRDSKRYLRLLAELDSVRVVGEASLILNEPDPMVMPVGETPEWAIELVRSLLDSVETNVTANGSPTVVAARVGAEDSSLSWYHRGWFRSMSFGLNHLTPESADSPCVSLLWVQMEKPNSRRHLENYLPRWLDLNDLSLLGPCAYYLAFGYPGNHVHNWLESGAHIQALQPSFLGERPRLERSTRYSDEYLKRSVERMRFDRLPLVPCAAGDAEYCSRAIHEDTWPYLAELPPGLVRPDRSRWWWRDDHPLGPRHTSYLSDLVVDQGHDRFREFWTSDQELEVAFQQAFGMPIEEWTMEWARSQIGTPRRGPSAPAGSVIMSLVLGLVFVGGGAAYATRREVS